MPTTPTCLNCGADKHGGECPYCRYADKAARALLAQLDRCYHVIEKRHLYKLATVQACMEELSRHYTAYTLIAEQ